MFISINILILLMVFVTSLVACASRGYESNLLKLRRSQLLVDETTGFNEFSGNAEVRQGSLLLLAELIQVQTEQ